MPQSNLFSFGPLELVAAAFSLPLFSLGIAVLVARASSSLPRDRAPRMVAQGSSLNRSPDRSEPGYLAEHRALGVAGVAVIVLFAVESVVRGYLLNPWVQLRMSSRGGGTPLPCSPRSSASAWCSA